MSDQLLTISEVAARLNVPRTSVYRIPYFALRIVRLSPRRARIAERDVELYIALRTGRVV